MGKVIAEITMSLDGFIAGANVSFEKPMGEAGERLHHWMFDSKTDLDTKLVDEIVKTVGAVIIGGRMYATAIDEAWGGANPFSAPVFVLSNRVPAKVIEGFTFVADGIESALEQAKAVAGDKNIWLAGGANVIQQYLKACLVDELNIHIASVLFGEGTRLFEHISTEHIELEKLSVVETPAATHLRYRVVK